MKINDKTDAYTVVTDMYIKVIDVYIMVTYMYINFYREQLYTSFYTIPI